MLRNKSNNKTKERRLLIICFCAFLLPDGCGRRPSTRSPQSGINSSSAEPQGDDKRWAHGSFALQPAALQMAPHHALGE